MTANGWFQIGFYLLVIFLLTKPVGIFMTCVFNREKTFLDPVLRPIEKLVYRLTGRRVVLDRPFHALDRLLGAVAHRWSRLLESGRFISIAAVQSHRAMPCIL